MKKHQISKYLRWMALRNKDLRFSQLHGLRVKPSVMWCHVIRWVSTNVSDDRSTFRTSGTTCPMTQHHIQEYLNLWHQSYLNYAFLNKNYWQWNPRSRTHSEWHDDSAMQTVHKFGDLCSVLKKSEDTTIKWNLVHNNRKKLSFLI